MLVVYVVVLVGSVQSQAHAEAPAELHWARSVAQDFLDAVMGKDPSLAAGLLSPELEHSLAALNHGDASMYLWKHLTIPYDKAEITSEELAPDKSEARFKGIVSTADRKVEFALRVARDAPGGKWSIRFLRIKE
jgi:hypothetical protein